MPPLVSILMPFYNTEAFLDAAISSVRRQTRRELELLLWDDGSADGSRAIAERHAAEDPRVRLVSTERRGYTRALAALHEAAKGTYIGWVDSDDWLAPSALAETTRVLDEHPETALVYTDHETMRENGRVVGLGRRCRLEYTKERLLVDFMTFHFRLFRRSIYDQLGGLDLTNGHAPDYDFCLRVSEVSEIRHLARPLYRYRLRKSSLSHAGRVEQIEASRRAVEAAIDRRGMRPFVELEVEIVGRFTLRQKDPRDA